MSHRASMESIQWKELFSKIILIHLQDRRQQQDLHSVLSSICKQSSFTIQQIDESILYEEGSMEDQIMDYRISWNCILFLFTLLSSSSSSWYHPNLIDELFSTSQQSNSSSYSILIDFIMDSLFSLFPLSKLKRIQSNSTVIQDNLPNAEEKMLIQCLNLLIVLSNYGKYN